MKTAKERTATKLNVTFEGPDISEGTSIDDFQTTLKHVQAAVRRMVNHLSGGSSRGRMSDAVKRQSDLRIVGIAPGSVVAELELPTSDDVTDDSEDYGQQAVEKILGWRGEDDDSLPEDVARELISIGTGVSDGVGVVRLGDPSNGRSMSIARKPKPKQRRQTSETINANILGSLKEVNWDNNTAQLHRYGHARHIKLRFHDTIADDMKRFANQYVQIRGIGKLNEHDQWDYVQISKIEGTRSTSEEFDLQAFLNNPNPKIFDPETIVRATEPFDVEEFIRGIHEGRDA